MAKTKKPAAAAPPPPIAAEPDVPPAAEPAKKYSFPNKAKCPECGTSATRAYSTKADTQYRKCRICRHAFKVPGSPL